MQSHGEAPAVQFFTATAQAQHSAGAESSRRAKAAVVQQRAEAKDYIDLDAILADGRIDLPMALSSAIAIYGPRFNPQITLKALSYFEDGNLGSLDQGTRDRLAQAAREVDLDRLPALLREERK